MPTSAGLLSAVVAGDGGLGRTLCIVLPGLSVARARANAMEVSIANGSCAKRAEAARALSILWGLLPIRRLLRTGRDLFQQKCESARYDGGGETEVGSGQFPRPPALRVMTQACRMADFSITSATALEHGMPAWNMPDSDVWQLVPTSANLRALHRSVPMRS